MGKIASRRRLQQTNKNLSDKKLHSQEARAQMDGALEIIKKQWNERQTKRMNLYKSFTDLLKIYPTLIAFATAAAFVHNGDYKPFDSSLANELTASVLYVFAMAGGYCAWAVFNDSLVRWSVHKDSSKTPYLIFGTLCSLAITYVPVFTFQYVLTHHHWLGH